MSQTKKDYKKNICVIDCGSSKTKDIIRIAKKTNSIIDRWYLYYPEIKDFKLEFENNIINNMILVQKQNEFLISKSFDEEFTKKYEYIIFSGGGIIEGIQEDIKIFFSYLKEITIPVFGICFGHQIIGLVFGSKIFYLTEKVKGIYKTEFVDSNLLTENLPEINIFEKNHSEAITLPYNFKLIAKSKTCEVEMIQHISKQIYGTQFHPEVSGKNGETLILNLLNKTI